MPDQSRASALRFHWLLGLVVVLVGSLACSKTPAKDPVLAHETFTLQSTAVGELRRLNVYTPPGYGNGAKRYPVLYMPDGGIREDFPHITNTIDSLIRQGQIAPVIVVGIENTERRRDLTGPTNVAGDREIAPVVGGSATFRSFIATELIPEVDRRYRTSGEKAIVGESLAGLFVVETFFLQPTLFNRYIAMDPSLQWNDHELVRLAAERLPAMKGTQRSLWMTASGTDLIYPQTDALAKILSSRAPNDLRWTYDPRRDEKHSTIFRATKRDAFIWSLWKQ